MVNLNENIINNNFYKLSDKELKHKFDELKTKNFSDSYLDIISINIEFIKRIYNYEFQKEDIEILNNFLNQTTTDISNQTAYFPFLIYTILFDIQNKQIHCLFLDDLTTKKYFDKSQLLYNALNIKTSCNTNVTLDNQSKDKIYSNNIIFSNWEKIGFDRIDVLNIKKMTEKFNLKFEQAFIFDIDRIIYDYEKLTLYIPLKQLSINKLKVKSLFEEYKNIVGISSTLSFEHKKIEKNFNIKTKLTTNPKEITKKITSAEEFFSNNQDEKIRQIANHIAKLNKEKQTIVVDINDNNDLEILVEYLKLKKIPYATINPTKYNKEYALWKIITSNNVTLLTNLMSATIEPHLGGDYTEIAKYNTFKANDDTTSNFYKEKFKKELEIQKEIAQKEAQIIQEQGGINIIFTSHYTELKLEYAILKNYNKIPIKNISFYNSPQDEIFKEFKLENINIFQKTQNSENKFLFNIFSKFMYYLKKYSINKFFVQQNGYLTYSIEKNQNQKTVKKREKIGRNDPCPCGSGKKYKNCCGE